MITHHPGCVAAPFCGCADAEIAALLSRAETAEKRAEEAERERDEARAGYRCVDCDVVFTREGLRAHCEDDLSKARAVIASMRGAPCPRCAETEAALAAALAAQERGAAEANRWFGQAQREGRARLAAEAEVERLTQERDEASACAQRVALGYKAEVERLRGALAEYKRRELVALMQEISEECYCAGWLCNLEYTLWDLAHEGGGKWGIDEVTAEMAADLLKLSGEAGGWWIWGDDHPEGEGLNGPRFVPLADWERRYAASDYLRWKTENAARSALREPETGGEAKP